MGEFVRVASVDDVTEDSCFRVEVKGHAIALFNLGGEIFAISDTCTHAEASLSEGEVINEEVVCPLHFATFNIRTGECTGPPADENLPSYRVRVNDDDVEVEI